MKEYVTRDPIKKNTITSAQIKEMSDRQVERWKKEADALGIPVHIYVLRGFGFKTDPRYN